MEQTEDWIDNMINVAMENCREREIVLWGKYEISDQIRDELKEQYGKEIAFYVDSDTSKIDDKHVLSPDVLHGKSDQYYVIIPIGFYLSVREKMGSGGYFPNVDYYYFCDCVVQQTPDYYEDTHGNKVIGNRKGLKFVCSGFSSVIEIGDNVRFQDTCIYVHSNSRVVIGRDTELIRLNMSIGDKGEVLLNEEVRVSGNTIWLIEGNAKFYVGRGSIFLSDIRGICCIKENASFIIGERFQIGGNYRFIMNEGTSISIGKDCLFSHDISMRSHDGHSIFDILTKENINSTDCIRKERKIVVGDHVWIGERAEILYNTQIGNGSIIGAMSLVKGKIPNNCIAAGVPARVIRKDIAWSRQDGAENIMECGPEYIHETEI